MCTSEDVTTNKFTKLDIEKSGFDFANLLDETKIKSAFNYINVYMGGGVAIGDINNDGLQDIYITANQSSSKLFLNKGNLQFEDITEKSGTMTNDWCTATTMADVNNDGWMDIYVCRAYFDQPDRRANLLFVNNQDGTFTERGEEYGINDTNYSVASAFFDYDLDGDLDLVVGNHPRYRAIPLMTHYNYWNNPVPEFSNRLFRNDGNTFTDVTEESGVLSYGFTLAVSTSDFTHDGLPDLFFTVDHDEPDLILKNNGDGTFSNITETVINQSSLSSMGIDAGDVNHDIFPDLFVAEMLSEDHYREKVNMSMQNVDRFTYLTDTLGYKYYQMHNFLYLNNGNETFSDVAQLANVDKSDWTWATLFMDYDNDGWQDLFCTNGWYKDIYNKDRKKVLDSIMLSLNGDMAKMNKVAEEYAINSPQTKIKNYLFRNEGDLNFSKVADQLGLDDKTITTGAAYGDLDNDGDLDLVINNLGENSFIYQNNASQSNNQISFEFNNHPDQSHLGAKIHLYYGGEIQHREFLMTRGFQSSCEPRVHFGLGDVTNIDKVEVIWQNGKMLTLNNVSSNQLYKIDYNKATQEYDYNVRRDQLVGQFNGSELGIDYIQKENHYNDYDIQVLLPHKLSEYGPFTSVGDVNGDKLDDVFIGSPQDQSAALYIQRPDGKFNKKINKTFEQHSLYEDGHSTLIDVDGDEDLDLIVASTGYEYPESDPRYQPRLYKNNGSGEFSYDASSMPDHRFSASCITTADFDNDGDMDFFLGGRLKPHSYPLSGVSAIFQNDGTGTFTNITAQFAPDLEQAGMIKDALWIDINNDSKLDLITVGEWTAIDVWIQEDQLVKKTSEYFEEELSGWWNCIEAADLNNDGKKDLIIGNLGKNYKYRASAEKPFMVYADDFDASGSSDIVLGTYYGDVVYPVRGKSCSSEQIPDLKNDFDTYEKFALSDIQDVYGEKLNTALKYEVTQFASIILFQNETGFEIYELPKRAQVSPVNGVVFHDINDDNWIDIIVAGNLYQAEIETGRADSGTGTLLVNNKDNTFHAMEPYESGICLMKDVKSINKINIVNSAHVLVGNNNDEVQFLRLE